MDIHYRLHGTDFVWDERKAASNRHKHDGVTFEQAATVFFDPLFRLVDAERNDEARDAIIGFDEAGRLLFVVHIQIEHSAIRIISARRATSPSAREAPGFSPGLRARTAQPSSRAVVPDCARLGTVSIE